MHYEDLLDIMQQRAERLGLTVKDGDTADTAELELYLFQALLDLAELTDIPAYMLYNQTLATTVPGQQSYELPETFGRLVLPRVRNRRGIYLFDGLRNRDLEYLTPPSFSSHMGGVLAKPRQFTVMGRDLWLFPIPDSSYSVRGTYLQAVKRPELTDEVMLPYPTSLIEQALFRLASDAGKNPQGLGATRTEALTRLATGSR